jgi:hypothetical protein
VDARAGDLEALANFLQRVLGAVADPEAHLDDPLLAGVISSLPTPVLPSRSTLASVTATFSPPWHHAGCP